MDEPKKKPVYEIKNVKTRNYNPGIIYAQLYVDGKLLLSDHIDECVDRIKWLIAGN